MNASKKVIKNLLAAAVSVMGWGAMATAPVVSDVSMTQDDSRRVTISYTLSEEPGIVTPDILTNGVSIGEENLSLFAGDVNRLVGTSGVHTITWRPEKAWPGHRIMDGSVSVKLTAWSTNAPPPYMVIDLTMADTVRFYTSTNAFPEGGLSNPVYKTDRIVMRRIPAANVEWRMGSPTNELGRTDVAERPHYVTLSEDFYIGIYEMTQKQYVRIMGSLPQTQQNAGDMHPIDKVSYNLLRGTDYVWPGDSHKVTADSFLGTLRAHACNIVFDLPTEAQWEYACRAGCGSALYTGEELTSKVTSPNLDAIAVYKQNGGVTTDVGIREPNNWGLFDMIGSVWELCLDWYEANYEDYAPETGPSSSSASKRVIRGGGIGNSAATERCASRNSMLPTGLTGNGFRVCCPVIIPAK